MQGESGLIKIWMILHHKANGDIEASARCSCGYESNKFPWADYLAEVAQAHASGHKNEGREVELADDLSEGSWSAHKPLKVDIRLTTKGDLLNGMEGLPNDTIIEIHVPGNLSDMDADYAIGNHGVVMGSEDPIWYNIEVGEFITNCG